MFIMHTTYSNAFRSLSVKETSLSLQSRFSKSRLAQLPRYLPISTNASNKEKRTTSEADRCLNRALMDEVF